MWREVLSSQETSACVPDIKVYERKGKANKRMILKRHHKNKVCMMRWRQCIFPKMFLPLSDNFRQHSISQTLPIPNTLSKGSGGQTSGHKLYHLYFPFTFTKWCHNENVILVFTVLIGFTFGGCRSKNGGVWPHTSCCFQCEADQRRSSIGNFLFVLLFSTFTFYLHFLHTPVVAPFSYFPLSLSPHTSCCFQCEADQLGRRIGNFFFAFIFFTFSSHHLCLPV